VDTDANMAGDTKPVPLSPRQGSTQIGSAAMQWARSRRGRVLVASIVFLIVLAGIAGARQSEVSLLRSSDLDGRGMVCYLLGLFTLCDMRHLSFANTRHC
jgi:hypothetical protein